MAAKEELKFDLAQWWARHPKQEFEVISADGRITKVHAHEATVGMQGSGQPILSCVYYDLRQVEATKTVGVGKAKKEVTETVDHPVMIYAASFNAGSWISFRDVTVAEIVEEDISIKGS